MKRAEKLPFFDCAYSRSSGCAQANYTCAHDVRDWARSVAEARLQLASWPTAGQQHALVAHHLDAVRRECTFRFCILAEKATAAAATVTKRILRSTR